MGAVTRRQRVEWRSLLNRRAAFALTAIVILVAVTAYTLFFRRPALPPGPGSKSVNSAAYDYYLRGKVNVGSETRESNENGIKLLEQAVAVDPNFAPAYAGLARAYIIKLFQFSSDTEKKELNEDAEVAVTKALMLNPDLPEGHFARGAHARRFPHKLAIQSYKRALALNPNLDEAHHKLV
jgi:tetratricopeptide (TPR) repeat protein